MTIFNFRHFLISIVGVSNLVFASGTSPDPQVDIPKNTPVQKVETDSLDLQQLDLSPPTKLERKEESFFYPYQKELAFDLGQTVEFGNDQTMQLNLILGIKYMWPSITGNHVETGFHLSGTGDGYFWTGYKKQFAFTTKIRPYFTIAPGVKLDPTVGMISFLYMRNYFLRGAGGFEFSIGQTFSSTVEFFVTSTTIPTYLMGLTVGLAMGL